MVCPPFKFGMALCPLSALALIAILVVALLIKGGKAVRWIAAIAAIVIALMFLAPVFRGVSARRGRVEVLQRSRGVGWPAESPRGVAVEVGSPGAPLSHVPEDWLSGVGVQFQADVYPSIESAAAALTSIMADQLDKVAGEESDDRKVTVTGNVEAMVLFEAAKVLEDQGIRAVVAVKGEGMPTRPSAEAAVLQLDVVSAGSYDMTGGESGKETAMKVSLSGPRGRLERHITVKHKQWVEDLEDYQRRFSPAAAFAVGYSRLAGTAGEATDQAIKDATAKLVPLVRRRLPQRRFRSPFGRRRQYENLPEKIERELRAGRFVVDRFVQRFDRPYGQVWREAVLVDASPKSLKTMATRIAGADRAERVGLRRTVFSLAALVVLICVVYGFLNAATRGYYTWSLRIAAVVLVVVGMILVLTVI